MKRKKDVRPQITLINTDEKEKSRMIRTIIFCNNIPENPEPMTGDIWVYTNQEMYAIREYAISEWSLVARLKKSEYSLKKIYRYIDHYGNEKGIKYISLISKGRTVRTGREKV